jgi:hypothetical protein
MVTAMSQFPTSKENIALNLLSLNGAASLGLTARMMST